jgi:DsbC/DsbD-like thiol-disulfide interchange protein
MQNRWLGRVTALWMMAAAFTCAASGQDQPAPKPGSHPAIEPPFKPLPDWKAPDRGGSKKTGQVKVRSTADVDAIVPGEPFLLAFIFDIEPGWHIYWKNSGASGAPTEIRVSAPAGYSIGRTLFPRPQAFVEPDGTVYGYEKETAIFVEVIAPHEPAATSSAMFRAEIDWLVCKDVCLKGSSSQMLTLSVSTSAGRHVTTKDATVDRFKARLPRAISDGQNDAVVELTDGILRVELPAQGRASVTFFPNETPGVTFGATEIKVEKDRAMIRVPVEIKHRNAGGNSIVINGLAALGDSLDDPCYEFEIPLPVQ